ncbi:MAG: ATP-binding protein [Methermicoccaceae archaeon]
MRQLAVVSGKGGAGKTLLTAALAMSKEDVVIADCDVEAPNLHLMLDAHTTKREAFMGMDKAAIGSECTVCGRCGEVCRFGAISGDIPKVDTMRCEGCGACALVCPSNAITFERRQAGTLVLSETQWGRLVYAELKPGESASGRLVAEVRKRASQLAQNGKSTVLIDGPPGSSCPTISTLTGVDAALVVCEPTLSALSDMKRVLALAEHFKLECAVCINKCGLNDGIERAIEDVCEKGGIDVVGRVAYDAHLFEAYVHGGCAQMMQSHPIMDEASRIWSYFENGVKEM